MIQAGGKSDLVWGDGNWVFLDIGFSNNSPSCGLLVRNEQPRCVRFSEALEKLRHHALQSVSPLNLVIEAPLSVCFNKVGNPKRRKIEFEGGQRRYWYSGPGCPVMVAAMYLIRALYDFKPRVPIRIFEGFISFKGSRKEIEARRRRALSSSGRARSKHWGDLFRRKLREEPTDILESAFCVIGLNCGIPAVIKPV